MSWIESPGSGGKSFLSFVDAFCRKCLDNIHKTAQKQQKTIFLISRGRVTLI